MAKQEITYKNEIIDGKEVKIQVIPQGMRTIPKEGNEGEQKAKKPKTTKPNPTKDGVVADILAMLAEKELHVMKSKTGYSFKIGEQWITVSITGNRTEPKDLKELEESGE